MKYVAVTFDDGRSDNYSVAFPVMQRHALPGVVYVTTGFVDGTWTESQVLGSPSAPLTVGQLTELLNAGWELSLHGDHHKTEQEDFCRAYDKLLAWLPVEEQLGFSLPNSAVERDVVQKLWKTQHPEKLSYIRGGRKKSTKGLLQKVLYVLSSFPGCQWAYRWFNKDNVYAPKREEACVIPSVVVKQQDKASRILRFIEKMPEDTAAVLMLHSILPDEEAQALKDPWTWSETEFTRLCSGLAQMQKAEKIAVRRLLDIVKTAG